MKKVYDCFVKAEEVVACTLLAGIVTLMFLSAVLRKAGMPINWAGDTSLLLFTWACFLGADLIIREKSMVNVDMLLRKFPIKVQKTIRIVCQIAAIALLISFVWFGVPLCIESVAREIFQHEPQLLLGDCKCPGRKRPYGDYFQHQSGQNDQVQRRDLWKEGRK